ncbi:MAG: SDR family NAD(P)-dependent oxidoreductase [Thermoleophilaceae bacterium]
MSLSGSRALVTGASGGIGLAIARALHARGATVIATARRQEVLDGLRADLGDRVEVVRADLADRSDVESLPGSGRSGGRAGGQRGAAGLGRVRRLLRRGGRPRAGREPARAVAPGARAGQADGLAGVGPPGLHLLPVGQGGEPRRLAVLGHQVRPARVRAGAAGGLGGDRGGRDHRLPGLHPRRRHVPRQRHQAATRRGHANAATTWPQGWSAGSRATSPKSTWPRWGCGSGRWRPGWRRGRSQRSSASWAPAR